MSTVYFYTGEDILKVSGVDRISQTGGEGEGAASLCHTQGTYQMVMTNMSTSTLCFTKSDIFSDEQ